MPAYPGDMTDTLLSIAPVQERCTLTIFNANGEKMVRTNAIVEKPGFANFLPIPFEKFKFFIKTAIFTMTADLGGAWHIATNETLRDNGKVSLAEISEGFRFMECLHRGGDYKVVMTVEDFSEPLVFDCKGNNDSGKVESCLEILRTAKYAKRLLEEAGDSAITVDLGEFLDSCEHIYYAHSLFFEGVCKNEISFTAECNVIDPRLNHDFVYTSPLPIGDKWYAYAVRITFYGEKRRRKSAVEAIHA